MVGGTLFFFDLDHDGFSVSGREHSRLRKSVSVSDQPNQRANIPASVAAM